MTRQEIEGEILSGLGGRVSTDDTVLLTVGGSDYSLVHKWINRSQRRIARKYNFDALKDEDTSLTTTANDDTPISLPSNTKSIMGVRIIDGTSSFDLTYKPPSWFRRWHPNPGAHSSSKPRLFTVINGAFRFAPVPNAIYTLYVDRNKWPSNLLTDASEPDFGDDLVDDIIVEFGIAYGFQSFGEVYKKDGAYHFGQGDAMLYEAFGVDNYIPAYQPTPDGYMSPEVAGARNALDATSFPSGVTHPFRNLR